MLAGAAAGAAAGAPRGPRADGPQTETPAGAAAGALRGTTLFVAALPLELRQGPCVAHVFQDIVDKQYVIALAFGDVSGERALYARVHSSCVTSETLCGCDCDCVQQLEGAIDAMATEGRGVLFYLLQEGRGVGYVAKSRDRMLVQFSRDRMSTFEAYESMGLRRDHRSYHCVSNICRMMGISAPFILLTNNPEKADAFRRHGLALAGTRTIAFAPSAFNAAYLLAKAASGHALAAPAAAPAPAPAGPPDPVEPFAPRALPDAQRFIYTSSYFLPVRLGDRAEERHCWFRVHVYFDLVGSNEYIVLAHGNPRAPPPAPPPIVRVQSDSLFDRLPLKATKNKDKLRRSLAAIVANGSGVLLLLYHDGRGAGFGAHAIDRMLTSTGRAPSSESAYKMLGVAFDSRDYDACVALLLQHVAPGRMRVAVQAPASIVKKHMLMRALCAAGADVCEWIFLQDVPLDGHPRE
jgi:GTP cyclohydrolase II